jgi:RNA recognition motif. (a.k.a. RRM, RBD, or RNP domain)
MILQVITDAITGRSKGYGFVRFAMENERDRSHSEMNGHFLSNRPIRVSLATARKNMPGMGMGGPNGGGMMNMQAPHPSDFDPTNTTLFIGGLSSAVSEDQLRALFGRFGDIIYVKIPAGKGCGFVQFVLRTSAERAMAAMNVSVLGNSAIRISWGRSSSRAANHAAQLATLAGLPAAAAAAAAFPGAFGDPTAQMLAATGGVYGRGPPPQFNGVNGMMAGGDPYAPFGPVGGQPPHDMFVSNGGMPYGMPPPHQHQGGGGGMGQFIDGPQFGGGGVGTPGMINSNPNGLLPPVAAAAAAAAAAHAAAQAAATANVVAAAGSIGAGSGPGSEVNGGSLTEGANGGAGTISAPSSAAGSDGITVDTPASDSAKGSGSGSFPTNSGTAANGTVGKAGGGGVSLVGTHLLASLLI